MFLVLSAAVGIFVGSHIEPFCKNVAAKEQLLVVSHRYGTSVSTGRRGKGPFGYGSKPATLLSFWGFVA